MKKQLAQSPAFELEIDRLFFFFLSGGFFFSSKFFFFFFGVKYKYFSLEYQELQFS